MLLPLQSAFSGRVKAVRHQSAKQTTASGIELHRIVFA